MRINPLISLLVMVTLVAVVSGQSLPRRIIVLDAPNPRALADLTQAAPPTEAPIDAGSSAAMAVAAPSETADSSSSTAAATQQQVTAGAVPGPAAAEPAPAPAVAAGSEPASTAKPARSTSSGAASTGDAGVAAADTTKEQQPQQQAPAAVDTASDEQQQQATNPAQSSAAVDAAADKQQQPQQQAEPAANPPTDAVTWEQPAPSVPAASQQPQQQQQQQPASAKASDSQEQPAVTAPVDARAAPNYGPAVGCTPPTLPQPTPLGVPIPPLPESEKPNFIIILTDDQGWDDMGLHHPQLPGGRPQFVRTPNLDRFIQRSTFFDNYYVAPMCSHSRAALLTGRDYAKSGTMLVNGGYDYINRNESTSGHVMGAAGYQSVHYGKWHNGRTLGYEPWHMGFQDSWFPELYINLDNMMRHNGYYVPTKGLMEQDLMDKMLAFLHKQEPPTAAVPGPAAEPAADPTGPSSDADAQGTPDKSSGPSGSPNKSDQSQQDDEDEAKKPFYLYYAPNAIHQGFMRPGVGPKWQRPAPEPYLAKYRPLARANIVSDSTVEVWAFLEYMDDVLGRLFDFIDSSPLRNNTYVMIMSDNGSELFEGEFPLKLLRMPSGMQDYKRSVREGGIRNYLAVQGPGVQGGVVDSTLLSITDILPTMADLAGIPQNETAQHNWDGRSFKNLLLGNLNSSTDSQQAAATAPGATSSTTSPATTAAAAAAAVPDSPVRGWSWSNKDQQERILFHLSVMCWDPDTVPALGPDRRVVKSQLLLDYDAGGVKSSVVMFPRAPKKNQPTKALKQQPLLDYTLGGTHNRFDFPFYNVYNNSDGSSVSWGFERCIAASYKNYKWLGVNGKVYRFENGSHIEAPCNEVQGPEGEALAAKLSAAARDWWKRVVAYPSSFQKPTFYLGLEGWNVTNVLPDGAHDRTPGRVRLLPNGLAGFSREGDFACFALDVVEAGTYEVVPIYTSQSPAAFKFAVGSYAAIQDGSAPSITATLPALKEMAGRIMGTLQLDASNGKQTEACLTLVATNTSGSQIFTNLGNIRMTRKQQQAAAPSVTSDGGSTAGPIKLSVTGPTGAVGTTAGGVTVVAMTTSAAGNSHNGNATSEVVTTPTATAVKTSDGRVFAATEPGAQLQKPLPAADAASAVAAATQDDKPAGPGDILPSATVVAPAAAEDQPNQPADAAAAAAPITLSTTATGNSVVAITTAPQDPGAVLTAVQTSDGRLFAGSSSASTSNAAAAADKPAAAAAAPADAVAAAPSATSTAGSSSSNGPTVVTATNANNEPVSTAVKTADGRIFATAAAEPPTEQPAPAVAVIEPAGASTAGADPSSEGLAPVLLPASAAAATTIPAATKQSLVAAANPSAALIAAANDDSTLVVDSSSAAPAAAAGTAAPAAPAAGTTVAPAELVAAPGASTDFTSAPAAAAAIAADAQQASAAAQVNPSAVLIAAASDDSEIVVDSSAGSGGSSSGSSTQAAVAPPATVGPAQLVAAAPVEVVTSTPVELQATAPIKLIVAEPPAATAAAAQAADSRGTIPAAAASSQQPAAVTTATTITPPGFPFFSYSDSNDASDSGNAGATGQGAGSDAGAANSQGAVVAGSSSTSPGGSIFRNILDALGLPFLSLGNSGSSSGSGLLASINAGSRRGSKDDDEDDDEDDDNDADDEEDEDAPMAPPAPGPDVVQAYAWLLPASGSSGSGGGSSFYSPSSALGGRSSFGIGFQLDLGAGLHPFLGATPGMLQVERAAIAAAEGQRRKRESTSKAAAAAAAKAGDAVAAARAGVPGDSAWQELRQQHLWPDGQGVFESMYSPYAVEGIGRCTECLPKI